MESSPSSPLPYEYGSGEKDKDKDAESKGGKKSASIRIPLPASEVHAKEPQRRERMIPLFQNFGEKEAEAEEHKKDKEKAKKPAEQVEPVQTEVPAAPVETEHKVAPDHIAGLEHDLWNEFDNAPPAPREPEQKSAAELDKPEPAEYDEAANNKEFFKLANSVDPEGQLAKGTEELAKNDNKEQPGHVLWDETHTVHVNTPPKVKASPEVTAYAAKQNESIYTQQPSAEAMTAEVAATEPDDLNAAPTAEVPANHPEAYREPVRPKTEQEQFDDIMRNASMGESFEASSSYTPLTAEVPAETPPPAQHTARPLGHYSGGSPGGASGPDSPAPSPFPVPESRPIDDDPYAQKWYPPRHQGGSSPPLFGSKTRTVPAAESGVPAAIKEQVSELKQTVQHQGEHVAALTNEQRVTHEEVERLRRARQHAAAEQQKAADEAVAATTATAAAAERVVAHNPDEKVVRSEWVDMVVDKRTGRLIEGPDVNNFGAELKAEQRHNIAPPDPIGDALAAAKAAAQASSDVSNYEQAPQPLHYGTHPMMGSGQIGYDHELTAGDGSMADSNHRLAVPRNPVLTALASPLLWVGAVVLILAFFAAAFL